MKRIMLTLVVGATVATHALAADKAKIVLVAGTPSHGPGEHEFNAGIMLLAKCLGSMPHVEPVVVKGGWPKDESVFDDAATVVFFMDGGGSHPIIREDHITTLQR